MKSAEESWCELVRELGGCRACLDPPPGLLHNAAKPLFGHFRPSRRGVLFVFEAPNLSDTTHPDKGYITYDNVSDPTGEFTKKLFTEILQITSNDFQVTNAVLCLPKRAKTAFTVRAKHVSNCSNNLRRQIEILDPVVVASVGATALNASCRIESFPYRTLECVVGRAHRWFGRWIFPLAHTSRQGRLQRSEEEQRSDWRALRDFLEQKGVNVAERQRL